MTIVDDRARAAQLHRARGLAAAHAANRARSPRRTGDATGWHRAGVADWRLTNWQANAAAALLEGHGWRAEDIMLGQGVGLVEVRDLRVRCTPLVATLRAPGEAEAWLAAHGDGRRV